MFKKYTVCITGVYQCIDATRAPVLPIVRTSGQAFGDVSLSLDDSQQAEVLWMSTRGAGADKPYFDATGTGHELER